MKHVILIIYLLQFSCNQVLTQRGEPKMRSVAFVYDLQLFDLQELKLRQFSDTLYLYYIGEYLIYQLGVSEQIETAELSDEGALINREVLSGGKQYGYFITRSDNADGYYYDSLAASGYRKYPVDSFIRARISYQESMFHKKTDSLIEAKPFGPHQILEKYVPKEKPDLTYCDSIYLYFTDEWKDLPYALAPSLDSLRKMKLFRVQLIYNTIPSGTSYPFEVPRREYRFEIFKHRIEKPSDILQLVRQHEKRVSKSGTGT